LSGSNRGGGTGPSPANAINTTFTQRHENRATRAGMVRLRRRWTVKTFGT
jgi:hypothetical protein